LTNSGIELRQGKYGNSEAQQTALYHFLHALANYKYLDSLFAPLLALLHVPGSIPAPLANHSNCLFPIFNYSPASQCRCGPYKATFAYFNLIRKHVLLNGVVLSQEGAIGPFFEGDMPLQIIHPEIQCR
jgi:hypothetical protein